MVNMDSGVGIIHYCGEVELGGEGEELDSVGGMPRPNVG
jgi:hypothetical protein